MIPGEAAVAKFAPWFPSLRSIPLPDEPCPEMSPREALLILEYENQCLYDGGTTLAGMGSHAWGVLEDLVERYERE